MACGGWASTGTRDHFTSHKERNCIEQRRKNAWPTGPPSCATAPRKNMPGETTPSQRRTKSLRPAGRGASRAVPAAMASHRGRNRDRKSTRLNSSHVEISYAVFCLKKKKDTNNIAYPYEYI